MNRVGGGSNLADTPLKSAAIHLFTQTNNYRKCVYFDTFCGLLAAPENGEQGGHPVMERTVEARLLYDRTDAARQLSVSVRSIDYIIAAKGLDTRRIGRKVLVTRASLVRYSAGNHYTITKRSDAEAVASGDKCA